jgi:PAS domain S-box-containing protein
MDTKKMNKGGVFMFNKLINAFKYKKYANPPEDTKRTQNHQGSFAGSGEDKGLGINLANYESNLQEFVPHFNSGIVEEITGYSQEEFEKGLVTWDKLVYPEDLPIFYQEDQRLKNKAGYVFNIEYRIIRKNGEIRWVKDIGRVLANPSELVPQLIGTICDITDKKLQDESMRTSFSKKD